MRPYVPDATVGLDAYLDREFGGQSPQEMEEQEARIQRVADDLLATPESCGQFAEALINDDHFEHWLIQALFCHQAELPLSRNCALNALWAVMRRAAHRRAEASLR